MSKKIIVIDRFEGNKVTKTAQGFLRVDGYVTRTGVLKYRTADGTTIKQLRSPENIFDNASLETLKSVPVTLKHPPQLITPKDVKKYMVGYSSDAISREGKKIKTQLTITDEAAIKSVEAGATVELSCGYECELEESSGIYDGEHYDFIQKNVKYNHIALVERGRAGPDIRILMDSADTEGNVYIQDDEATLEKKENCTMEKVMIDGKEYDASPELAAALKSKKEKEAAMQTKMDALEKLPAEKEKMQATLDGLTSDLAKTKEELVKAQADLKSHMDSGDEKKIEEKVKSRLALIEQAKRFVAKDTKLEEMSDLEIKKAVIKADLPSVSLDGKTEEYVTASFDYVCERTKSADEKLKDVGKKLTQKNKDEAVEPDPDAVRKKSMEQAASAWKLPLSKEEKK